jgi:hypothetical protein
VGPTDLVGSPHDLLNTFQNTFSHVANTFECTCCERCCEFVASMLRPTSKHRVANTFSMLRTPFPMLRRLFPCCAPSLLPHIVYILRAMLRAYGEHVASLWQACCDHHPNIRCKVDGRLGGRPIFFPVGALPYNLITKVVVGWGQGMWGADETKSRSSNLNARLTKILVSKWAIHLQGLQNGNRIARTQIITTTYSTAPQSHARPSSAYCDNVFNLTSRHDAFSILH